MIYAFRLFDCVQFGGGKGNRLDVQVKAHFLHTRLCCSCLPLETAIQVSFSIHSHNFQQHKAPDKAL